MDIQPADGSAEIGYWVHPAARGRGVASEATRMIVRHAAIPISDGGLGLRRLTLHAAASNLASQRVAENAGFALTGRQRAAERLGDGSVEDLLDYDLICADVTAPYAGRRARGAGASQGIEGGGCLPRRTAAPRVPVTFAAAVVRRGRAAGRRGLAGSVSEHATFAPDVETRYGISRLIQPMRKGQCGLGVWHFRPVRQVLVFVRQVF